MPDNKVKSLSQRLIRLGGKNYQLDKGFTLIELLVVMAIAVIISAVGVASYNRYAARQLVDQVTLLIKHRIEETRAKSVSFIKPSNCTVVSASLEGYTIEIFVDPQQGGVKIDVNCTAPANSVILYQERYPDSVEIELLSGGANCTAFFFETLTNNFECANGNMNTLPVFRISSGGVSRDLRVEADGNVTIL